MVEFDPVQTNQMLLREKILQRLWELVRPAIFGCTLWFARKARLRVVRYAAKIGGG